MWLRRARTIGLLVTILVTIAVPAVLFAKSLLTAESKTYKQAKNVILFLGDGMGDSEITLARDYAVGAAGRLSLDRLPFVGSVTTYAVQEEKPHRPEYVTSSAASASGWSTGEKTSNRRISTTPGTDEDLPTLLELAQKAGYATGDITTADLTDATPAAAVAHVSDRDCRSPAEMKACPKDKKSAGGPGSIAEQEIDHKVNVLLGGGKKRFSQVIENGNKTLMEVAQTRGYTVVTDTAGMQKAQGKHVLGLFHDADMSLEWKGEAARPYPGSGPQTCQQNQRPANEPSLAAMTLKALELLQKSSEKGFLLQVEGASIDKQSHIMSPCQQIGETIAFDSAVKVGLDFAQTHPETLILVMADHGQTAQIIQKPEDSKQPGAFSKLITKDGSLLYVSYATAPQGKAQSHTGTQVRIAAIGPNAQKVSGVLNQTDIFDLIVETLKLR